MYLSRLSATYKLTIMDHCLRLDTQWIARALAFALDKAGKSMDARMAMMAMTTSSSIRVNPKLVPCLGESWNVRVGDRSFVDAGRSTMNNAIALGRSILGRRCMENCYASRAS